jgi:hypothetical protein
MLGCLAIRPICTKQTVIRTSNFRKVIGDDFANKESFDLFIPFGSNTPKLASAFAFGIMSDGKSLYSQKPQRVGSDVPSGMPGEVSTRSDER